MGLITRMYQNNFLQRFNKDEAVPYLETSDFPGLVCEQNTFQNSSRIMICYYVYYYTGFIPDKIILFCPGCPGTAGQNESVRYHTCRPFFGRLYGTVHFKSGASCETGCYYFRFCQHIGRDDGFCQIQNSCEPC